MTKDDPMRDHPPGGPDERGFEDDGFDAAFEETLRGAFARAEAQSAPPPAEAKAFAGRVVARITRPRRIRAVGVTLGGIIGAASAMTHLENAYAHIAAGHGEGPFAAVLGTLSVGGIVTPQVLAAVTLAGLVWVFCAAAGART